MDIVEKLKDQFTGTNLIYNLVDILLVTILLYVTFSFLKRKNCARLIKYIVLLLIAFTVLGSKLNSEYGLRMMGSVAPLGLILAVIAVVLLFSHDIRRSLWRISSPKHKRELYSTEYDCTEEQLHIAIDGIVRAVQNMAKNNVGAIVVIAPMTLNGGVIDSGIRLNSELSHQLLECVFNPKAPLHDGAVFVRGNKVIAAGCFLPLTQSLDVDKELGTRHRAAIGITETENVMAIIVSEETGVISVAINGILTRYYNSEMLKGKLEEVYGLKTMEEDKKLNLWRKS